MSSTKVTKTEPHMLKISPSKEIVFEHRKNKKEPLHTGLTLKNVAYRPVAFKFRTNHIEAYRLRPSSGIIQPEELWKISVELIAGYECKPNDKLLLLSMKVTDGIEAEDMDKLWKKTAQNKLETQSIHIKQAQTGKDGYASSKPASSRIDDFNAKDSTSTFFEKKSSKKHLPEAPHYTRPKTKPKTGHHNKSVFSDTSLKEQLKCKAKSLGSRNRILTVLLFLLVVFVLFVVAYAYSLHDECKSCRFRSRGHHHPSALFFGKPKTNIFHKFQQTIHSAQNSVKRIHFHRR